MADQAIAQQAPPSSGAKVAPSAPVKLPEAFRDAPEQSGPEPEMDAFAELEKIDAENPSPDSRPPKKDVSKGKEKPKTPEPTKPAAKETKQDKAEDGTSKPDATVEKTEPAPDGKDDDGKLPESDPSKKFQLASELRRDYRRIHTENEKLRTELQSLKKDGNAPSEDRKALDSQIETLKKRNDDLEKEIRYLDYTKSNEFQEKFRKPFATKQAHIYQQIEDLYVRDPEGNERQATKADFDRVFDAPQADARRIAKELFGEEDFREVLQYRRELMEISQNAEDELKRYREESDTRTKSRITEEKKLREHAEASFRKSIDRYTEKYPDWFGKVEGDDELNKAMAEGFESVDRSVDRNVPLDERVDLLAAARLKAASFGRHVLTIKRLKARVSELETALKDYEKSAPGEGEGKRSSTVSGLSQDSDEGDVNAEIDALERRTQH